MNIDHWIARLDEPEPSRALDRLREAPPERARAAVPTLLALAQRSDRSLRDKVLTLAIHLRPEHDVEIVTILETLLEDEPCGWMLPSVVTAFEQLGPRSDEAIEILGKALSYPHPRIRVAAARGLATMGALLELVERPLAAAMDDPAIEVRQAAFESLLANADNLPATLGAIVNHRPQSLLNRQERESLDRFEDISWRQRAAALNGLGDDGEDVVLCLRPRTNEERDQSDEEVLERLLANHGLPAGRETLRRTDTAMSEHVWMKMLCPLFSEAPVTTTPIEEIANRWVSLFDREVRLYSNVVFEDGVVARINPVSSCLIDAGLVGIDSTRVGMFWVADED